ncbi:MAG TPA: ATP synthase subunit I [Gammaproteobacteria bacterium]|jgi:ATP synthase protein I|nr:ATP synthase subunit I [Gammaproteobacteria bacterium]
MTTPSLTQRVQHQAYAIVGWQLAGVGLFALLALLINGKTGGLSVLAGGLAYGLPNLIFVWRVFRYSGAQQMTQFMTAFYLGEVIKLILSGILFLVIVKYLPVSLLSVLIGYAGAIMLFWIVCMWYFSRPAAK